MGKNELLRTAFFRRLLFKPSVYMALCTDARMCVYLVRFLRSGSESPDVR